MNPDNLLSVYLQEYDKLKDEQTQRIGFRDNIIYINLVAVGAVGSFAITQAATQPNSLQALFIIPWVCLVLGWTYLVNDEKISAIGRYLRKDLDDRLRACLGASDPALLGWEVAHRSDKRRLQRKYIQWAIDEITFCVSGWAAIAFYFLNPHAVAPTWIWLGVIEGLLLLALAIQIGQYADLRRGR